LKNNNNNLFSKVFIGARGAFDWLMYYKRLPLLPSQVEKPTEPFE
jgi:hypothetical protein